MEDKIIKLSKIKNIGNTEYCVYCCKEAKEKIIYGHPHNGDPDEYYYSCDCEKAKSEIKMNEKIDKIKSKYGLIENYDGLNKLQYEYELMQLKNKHGIK